MPQTAGAHLISLICNMLWPVMVVRPAFCHTQHPRQSHYIVQCLGEQTQISDDAAANTSMGNQGYATDARRHHWMDQCQSQVLLDSSVRP